MMLWEPILAILFLILFFGVRFAPMQLWEFFTWLSNFDVISRQWNILGVVWACTFAIYGAWEYKNRHKEANWIVALTVGICALLFFYSVMDEVSIFSFIFTREEWMAAFRQFFLIPQKWVRWLGIIPVTGLITWLYAKSDINFKRLLPLMGITSCVCIIGITCNIYDIRALEYPFKTWAYIFGYVGGYTVWTIGYFWFWMPSKVLQATGMKTGVTKE